MGKTKTLTLDDKEKELKPFLFPNTTHTWSNRNKEEQTKEH